MLSHEDEVQMNGAFANIGLIANKVWAHDQEDKYRKLNQSLWLQNCKLSETYSGKSGKRTRVRDVIPESRLAQYGNYEYSHERERLYNCDVNEGRTLEEREKKISWYKDYSNAGRIEPWMFKQVDECFVRLMSLPTSAFLSLAKGQQFRDDESGKFMGFPCAMEVDHEDELQLRARICSKHVQALWAPSQRRHYPDGQSQTRSRLTNFTQPRIFGALTVVQQQQQQHEEKNSKMRRYCADKRPEIIRKTCHQQNNSYGLRNNDGTFGVIDKRSSLFCPVVAMSAPIASSRPSIVPAILCPEVAEFFPKGPIINVIGDGERRVSSPVRFFPSSAEPSYKEELFPYDQRHFSSASSTFTHNASGLAIAAVSHPATMNTWIGPNQWIQRIAPPIQIQVPGVPSNVNPVPTMYSSIQPFCTPPMALHHHRPMANERIIIAGPGGGPVATPAASIVTSETAPIPVYQRPAELYQDSYGQRRASSKSGQGVDYKNLILLTKSAMKARRNQSRNPRRASSFILESRQPNLKSESDVLRWLNKGYPKRAREFGTVNSLVGELTRFGGKCDLAGEGRTTSLRRMDGDEVAIDVADVTEELLIDDEEDEDDSNLLLVTMARKKRLYRDVLTNGGASTRDIICGEPVLDKRYDELEQQAMEQYRTSEECLAMRYQVLCI